MKKYFFLSLIFIIQTTAFGQGYLTLSGKIIDKTTQKPISYAHLGINGKSIGTFTNSDGAFFFRYPRLIADSTLVVAVMGFKKFSQKISTFQANQKDVVIQLETARPQVLDSAFIKRFEARELVIGALSKVKKNASLLPYLLTGFYTETLQQNADYIEIREATLQSEKDSRPKIEIPEKLKLVKGRMFQSENRSKMLEAYNFPNGAAIVSHGIDVAIPEYLEGKNLFDYNFQLDDSIMYYYDKSVYRVRFWPQSASIKGAKSGLICINEADSAIVRIEYEFTPSGMRDILKTTTADKVFGKTKREPKRLYSAMNYMPFAGKWYLQDYQLLLDTQFDQAKTQLLGTIQLHFMTTDIQKSNGSRIADTDVLLTTDNLPSQNIPKYDENFWGVFNYAPATEAMKLIIGSLVK